MDFKTGGSRSHRVVTDDGELGQLEMCRLHGPRLTSRLSASSVANTTVYHHEDRKDGHGGTDNADQDQQLVKGASRGTSILVVHTQDGMRGRP